jgi:hypothetical protein
MTPYRYIAAMSTKSDDTAFLDVASRWNSSDEELGRRIAPTPREIGHERHMVPVVTGVE